MLQNYLTSAWRNLRKHRYFSLINLLGLAIGMAACLFIFLYVKFQLGYDRYNENYDRIARVTTTLHSPESDLVLATCSPPLAPALLRHYPEVQAVVRLESAPQVIRQHNELFREPDIYQADSSIFSVFSFQFLEGSAGSALNDRHSIVLAHSLAKKYFGEEDAMGKMLICNQVPRRVSAIVADRPANSDMLIKGLILADYSSNLNWADDLDGFTYVLFRDKPDLPRFQKKMAALSSRYAQKDLDAMDAPNYHLEYFLEPLSAVHFSQGKLADTPKGNRQRIGIFTLLALFILFIAVLNYINLSTAKSMERAREVGIRKLSGALGQQLILQFFLESVLIVGLAALLAWGLLLLGIPFFNSLLHMQLSFDSASLLPVLGLIFGVTVLLAGSYPAFVLSRFRPAVVLKGSWRHGGRGILLRKILTVIQFSIAAGLILGTCTISGQLHFLHQMNLGYNQNQLVSVYVPDDSVSISAGKAFQNALLGRPETGKFTVGSRMSEEGLALASTIVQSGGKKKEFMYNYFLIDPKYLPVMQIQLAEGRNLSDSLPTDKDQAFLVNEAFLRAQGWSSGVGRSIDGFDRKGKIVGVIKDFYYKSLHNLVEPLVLIYNPLPNINTITLRIRPGDFSIVKDLYKEYFPNSPIEYSFLDEKVENQYRADEASLSLFSTFTLLAVLISALGLYGLVSLIGVQRVKEIGIRKILGAGPGQLLVLLSKDFMWLALISLSLALPVCALLMNRWLAGFAYHVPLRTWMFLVPVASLLLVTAGVISREVVRAIRTNPVISLRAE